MQRRRGSVEGFLAVAMRLPSALAVVLALVSWFVCHLLARFVPLVPSDTHGLTLFALEHYASTLAAILQYVLPLLFLFAATGSYLQRRGSLR
jgi:hypothetical protein